MANVAKLQKPLRAEPCPLLGVKRTLMGNAAVGLLLRNLGPKPHYAGRKSLL